MKHPFRWLIAIAVIPPLLVQPPPLAAEDLQTEMKAMRRELEALRRSEAEKQRRLDELERKLDSLQKQPVAAPVPVAAPTPQPVAAPAGAPAGGQDAASALDKAIAGLGDSAPSTAQPDLWSRPIGGATRLRLIDISFDTLLAVGSSTATDNQLGGELEAGAHDPQRRGFTLQQAELSFQGAVDPYLTGEAHIVYTPNDVELEEAFMTTSSLPYGLQLELGQMLTEYGLLNPVHPHAWDWIDQPVINSRLMGGEGLRAPGARLGWLTPLPWFSEINLGVQNANQGETTYSFISEESFAGRPPVPRSVHTLSDMLYLMRWVNFWNLRPDVGLEVGSSGLYGPNSSGSDGQTWIYGGDFKLRWRPGDNFRGWPFLIWQTEFSKRDYTAASYSVPADPPPTPGSDAAPVFYPRSILRDYGFYTQALYGFHYGWASGLRFEYATGSGESVGGRENDPLRDDRYRLSPLLVWQPTEFSRFRLQYNYDNARFLPERDAHSVWVGAEILYGMHPAHKY